MATRGQPKKQPWEKCRAIAWVHEVQRLAQMKMTNNLPVGDPFGRIKKRIAQQWTAQQRHKNTRDIVQVADLDRFLLGEARTDFYQYSKGIRTRVTSALLMGVNAKLAGVEMFFEVGPNGIPLWAALAGKITAEAFWIPIVQSGQVTEALGLPLDSSERFDVEERRHYPKLITEEQGGVSSESFDAVLKHQARVILPIVPWQYLVRTLAEYFAPCFFREHPEQPFGSEMIKAESVNVGVATLVVALGQLALKDLDSAAHDKDILCQLLLGIIPFWQKVDDLHCSDVKPQFSGAVQEIVMKLSII